MQSTEQERIKNYEECHLKIGLNTSTPVCSFCSRGSEAGQQMEAQEGGEDAKQRSITRVCKGKVNGPWVTGSAKERSLTACKQYEADCTEGRSQI